MMFFDRRPAARLLLIAVATATMAASFAADEWVLAQTHIDDSCNDIQRMSYFKVGACYNDNAPLKTAERGSRRFNADKTHDAYGALGCTGTLTKTNLTLSSTCGGKHKAVKWGIPPKSVPTSSIQITMAFVNAPFPSTCTGNACCTNVGEARWDVTYSMISTDPLRQMTSTGAECYADVRLARPGNVVSQTDPYSTIAYSYRCRDDKQMVYTSYPRIGSVRDCLQAHTARYDNLGANFNCQAGTVDDPPRYSVGCGTLKDILVDNGVTTGPFMEDTPWGWDYPAPPPSPPPSPPPPSPPPLPPSPHPPPSPPSPPPKVVEVEETTGFIAGVSTAAVLACCMCVGLGYLYKRRKDRQRIVAISIKQLQQMFSRMDTDKSGLVDTSEFVRGFRMPDDLYTARLLKMLDADDNGYISFQEMVSGIARFHGCVSTHDFAFRLLDAKSTGTVRKDDVLLLMRGVIGTVMAERKGKSIGEQYNTKAVMEFMKDMKEEMAIEDFEDVEMQFPGIFGGVAVIWEQFEDVVEPCARIVANGELGDEYGVDEELADEDDVRGGLLKSLTPGASSSGKGKDIEEGVLPDEPGEDMEEIRS